MPPSRNFSACLGDRVARAKDHPRNAASNFSEAFEYAYQRAWETGRRQFLYRQRSSIRANKWWFVQNTDQKINTEIIA